jgi:hypothetical protein
VLAFAVARVWISVVTDAFDILAALGLAVERCHPKYLMNSSQLRTSLSGLGLLFFWPACPVIPGMPKLSVSLPTRDFAPRLNIIPGRSASLLLCHTEQLPESGSPLIEF